MTYRGFDKYFISRLDAAGNTFLSEGSLKWHNSYGGDMKSFGENVVLLCHSERDSFGGGPREYRTELFVFYREDGRERVMHRRVSGDFNSYRQLKNSNRYTGTRLALAFKSDSTITTREDAEELFEWVDSTF